MNTLIRFGDWVPELRKSNNGIHEIVTNENLVKCHTVKILSVLNIFEHQDIVLISVGGDLGISRYGEQFKVGGAHGIHIKVFEGIPDNIQKWYCTNANVVHDSVSCLPIGVLYTEECLKLGCNPLLKPDLLYLNFQISTNPTQRTFVSKYFARFDWVTNDLTEKNDIPEYLRRLQSHKYALCPYGNGFDTYRFWECIYVGTIPIVLRSEWAENFESLPVLIVDDWTNVTESFLESKYEEIISKPKDMAYKEYWDNEISKSIQKVNE